MIIGQNTAKIIEVLLFNEETQENIDINSIEVLEIGFGYKNSCNQIFKYYKKDGTGEVIFDLDKQIFLVPLSQEDTQSWSNPRIPVQLRVKFTDGMVESTDPQMWDIRQALSDEVL